MASKSSNFEVETRVNKIYDMLLVGESRASILQFASRSEWGVSDRAVDEYIKKANARFKRQSQTVHDEQLGKAISRLNNLYMKCMQIQDYKAALAVQKDLNALLGLYAPKKTDITLDIKTVEATMKALEALGQDPAAVFNEIIARAKLKHDAGS